MADDVNKSSKPVNAIDAVGSSSSSRSIEDVVSRARQSINKPIAEIRKLQQKLQQVRSMRTQLAAEYRYKKEDEDLNEEGISPAQRNEDMTKIAIDIAELTPARDKTLGQLRSLRHVTNERSEAGINRAVSRFVSPKEQQSRIRGLSRSVNTLEPAIHEADQRGYLGLEQIKMQKHSQAAGIAAQIEDAQKTGNSSLVNKLGKQLGKVEQDAAVAEKGQQYLRQQGLDPQSKLNNINRVSLKAQDRLKMDELSKTTADTGGRSVRDISAEISDVASALKELKEGFNEGAISLEEFNEKAGEASQKFEDLTDEEKASAAAGGGGRMGRASRFFQGAAIIGGAAVNIGQALAVDHKLAQINNAAAVGGQANEKYDSLTRAIQGDMMAQNMILGGGFASADEMQNRLGSRQKYIKEGQIATDTLTGGAAGATAWATGGLSLLAGGASTIADSASKVAIGGSDVINRVSEGQTGANAFAAQMNMMRQIAHVPARQQQAYSDYVKGLSVAGRESGSYNTTDEMNKSDFIQKLIDNRISTSRAMEAAQTGIAAQGSDVFSSSQVVYSRGLEKMGLGSMEQQMQRMGTLAQQGSKDPMQDLERIMEEAVSRGFTNSKGVQLMVDSVQGLAQAGGLTALGIDAAGGMTALIGRTLGKKDPSSSTIAEMNEANTAISGVNDVLMDDSVSLANVARDIGLRKVLKDPLMAKNAARLTAQDLSVLQSDDEDAKVKLLKSKGLVGAIGKDMKADESMINGIVKVQQGFLGLGGSTMAGAFAPIEVQKAAARIREDGISDEEFKRIHTSGTPTERAALQHIFSVNSIATGGKGTTKGMNALFGEDKERFDIPESIRRPINVERSSDQDIGDKLISDIVSGTEAQAGNKGTGGIKALGGRQKVLEDSLTKNIDAWSTAAANAAKTMNTEVNTEQFKKLGTTTDEVNTSLKNFGTTLDGLNKKFGEGVEAPGPKYIMHKGVKYPTGSQKINGPKDSR